MNNLDTARQTCWSPGRSYLEQEQSFISGFINTFEHMSEAKICAIVCAAGTSSRMGKDNKLLLTLPLISMIEHTVVQLMHAPINELLVVTGHDSEQISDLLSKYNSRIRLVFHPEYEQGQTSTIQAGIRNMIADNDAIMICLSDMPLLTTSHYDRLIQAYNTQSVPGHPSICRPVCAGRPGHPVIMNKALIPAILECTEINGPRSVIKEHSSFFRPWMDCDRAYYTDIDDPEDLKSFIDKNL